MAQLFIILSLAVALPCFAGEVKNSKGISEDEAAPTEKVEVLTVDSLDKADSFAKTLEGSGYRSTVVIEDLGGKKVYKVFILVPKGEQIPDISGGQSQGPTDKKPAQGKERSYGPDRKPSWDILGRQNRYLHGSLTFKKPAQGKERSYGPDRKPSWDILGRQNRYVHGSLTLSGIFSDNVLNSRTNKISDFSTLLSPAIWLTFPHSDKNIAPAALSIRSPGGSLLGRQWPDSTSHYQASLYYRADIPLSSSSGNLLYGTRPAQTVSGRLLIKGNRFSLLAEDNYEFSYHEQGVGTITRPGEQNIFNSNYFGVTLSYDTQHRFVLGGGYSHFTTSYKSAMSAFQNRRDNGLFGVLTYKLSPKVNLLAEYRFFDISYVQTRVLDSSEHNFMGGILWKITAKSQGRLMAGYSVKKLDHSSGSFGSFSLEAQLEHRFTPKTLLSLSAYRTTSETDAAGMAFSVTDGIEVRLQHLLTSKLTSSAGFLIINDHYKNGPELTEGFDSRSYQLNLALQYAFQKWLKGGIGYTYTMRNSALAELEYRSNTFYFNITPSF